MTEELRPGADLPAAQRPVRHRTTARVLLVDPHGRLLLFADSDPGLPGSSWWITPGGGLEAGEGIRDAAVREVAEETGAVLRPADLIGPIAVRDAVHGYTDVVVEQREVYFGAAVSAFEVDRAGHTPEEQLTLLGHRWWSRADLKATADDVWPRSLLRIWDALTATRAAPNPGHLPVDLGRQEESTVPVGDAAVQFTAPSRTAPADRAAAGPRDRCSHR